MPRLNRRRPAVEEEPPEEEGHDVGGEEEEEEAEVASTQRQRGISELGDENYDEGATEELDGASSNQQLVKKLVRFALACEYARIPIRRADIVQKILGPRSRQFRAVFDEAQEQLRAVFGMEMTLYPLKEKFTIRERLAAQKTEKTKAASNAWILTSTLPDEYRSPTIIPPSRAPTSAVESVYVGLYTFVISVITLAGGKLPEAKLERYLSRVNANQTTPIDSTDKLIQRMIKDGYIAKVKDLQTTEELVDYVVGQRGSVEVGPEQIAGLVTTVYGPDADEELGKKLEKSLEYLEVRDKPDGAAKQDANGAGETRGALKRRRRDAAEDEEWS